MAMARHTFADDPAVGDVERGEQGRRPVPLVVVGHRAGAAFLQRQSPVGCGQAPGSGSSRRPRAPAPCPVGRDKAQRCPEPSHKTSGRWRA